MKTQQTYIKRCAPVVVLSGDHRLGICSNVIDGIDIATKSRCSAVVVRIRDGAALYQVLSQKDTRRSACMRWHLTDQEEEEEVGGYLARHGARG